MEVGGLVSTGVNTTFEWTTDGVEFGVCAEVANNATATNFTVTHVTISATGSATHLYTSNSSYGEIYVIENPTGYARFNEVYELSTRTELIDEYDNDATNYAVFANETTRYVYLIEFVEERGRSGNYDPVDMRGETVTITFEVVYEDGTTDTETVTIQL